MEDEPFLKIKDGAPQKKKKKSKPGKKRREAMRKWRESQGLETKKQPTMGAQKGGKKKGGSVKKAKKQRVKGQLKTINEIENGDEKAGTSTIMISGLNFDATEEDVRNFFGDECAVSIVDVSVPLYKDGPRNRGVAFVKVDTNKKMHEMIQQFDKKELMDRYLDLRVSTAKRTTGDDSYFAKELSEKPEMCRTVGVFNLCWKVTEEKLAKHFKDCGEVFATRIVEKNGRSAGYGYVEFVSMNSVDNAVELTGTKINKRPIRVDYAPNWNE
mmetsp:Transcript_25592/g.42884  ORF Transcript_25592/g.42884 Transcript_25592/m.42884 type:complete len:270 (-) Transcript_25592:185-994(-)